MRNCFYRAAGVGLSLAVLAGGTAAANEALKAAVAFPTGLGTADTAHLAITPTADMLLDAPVIEPPSQGWTFAITPRLWLLWENDFFFQPLSDPLINSFQQSNEATFIPFAGGSVSVTPGPGAPTYSLTVLYGEGSADVHGVQTFLFTYEGDVDTKRLDVEAIAQIPTAEGFSWIVGGRFIRFDRQEEGVITDLIFLEPPFFEDPIEQSLEQHFYLAEGGFSLNRPVTADGSIVAFGNLVGMLGYADVVDSSRPDLSFLGEARGEFGVFNVPEDSLQGGVFGVDTNAGLGYFLSPNIFASARYRLFYLTAPDFKFKGGGNFMHGPEFNLTFTFGG